MAEDITAPLEQLGHVTQQIVPPAITGAEITRLESIKTLVPRALENLASGIGDLGSSVARLASQAQEPSQPFVTRDQQGNIQVQPQPGILFGPNASALSHAALHGTVAGAGWRIGEDLNKIQAQHLGDPQGFLTAANGYLASQQQGFAAGGTKIANAINEEAQQRIGEIHGGMLLRQGALDIQNSRTAVDTRINSLSNDMYQLAAQGGMQSPQFAQKQAELQGQYGALASNPVYGVPKEQADALFNEKMATFRGASIVGQMDAAYHEQGATSAQKQLHDSVGALPNLSEPERAQLIARGNARLSYLQGQNADAIAANQQKLDALDKLINAGKMQATSDLLQPVIAEAHRTGDTDTVSRAMAIMQAHPIKQATEGLMPSQMDQAHGALPSAIQALPPTPGRNPDLRNVDQRLLDIVGHGQEGLPPGYRATINEGFNPAGHAEFSQHHVAGKGAIDIQITDPQGNVIPNRGEDATGIYGRFARAVTAYQQRQYPGLTGQLAWGGAFGTTAGSGVPDLMHFDLGGERGNLKPENRPSALVSTLGSRGAPGLDRIQSAIIGQESGGNPNVRGGVAQIQPATFAAYARPGESITRTEDQLAVSRRILADYSQRYNGDPARIAVAYFSGPGNVAPAGSPTPWKEDKTDANGKMVSSYVADIQRRLSGGAPTTVVSANGVPFTAQQLNDNPYLASELVKATAADTKNRNQMADAVMTGIERGLSNHMTPSADNLAMAGQLVQGNPKLEERYSNIEDRVRGEGVGQAAAGYAGGQALIDQARANANGADFHQQAIAAQAYSARNYVAREIDQNPAAAAARIGITPHGAVLPPIDTGDPQAIADGIAVRGGIARAMMDRGLAPRSAVFPPDRPAVEGLLSTGSPQGKAALLDAVANLPDPIREATMADPAAKAAVLSMAHSGQPQLMSKAYAFLDQEYRRNPMTFDGTFGAGTLKELRNWQDDLSWKTPEQIADREMKAGDPATIRAQENMRNLADESLKNFTGKDVAGKFVSWLQRWTGLGGDYLPLGESMGGMTLQAMRDDYQRAYRESFALNANPTAADKYAMEKISGIRDGVDTGGGKWSVSAANNGRIMAWAPERSQAYPAIDGSKDYIRGQIGQFINDTVQRTISDPREQQAMMGAPYALVPDARTQTEMTSGARPSYQVVLQNKDNGRLAVLPDRFTADPGTASITAQSRYLPRDLSALPATAWKGGF